MTSPGNYPIVQFPTYNKPPPLDHTPSVGFSVSFEPPSSKPRCQPQIVFYGRNGEPLRPPTRQFIGRGRSPKVVHLEIEGVGVTCYKYRSGLQGRNCRLEIIEGPNHLVGKVTSVMSGKHVWRAEAKCIDEFASMIRDHESSLFDNPVMLDLTLTDPS